MLHSDQLANEFNDILNGVEIFAPFQPLDPAIVFYAPLRNNVRDLRLNPDDFQRNSDAWYKDGSGIYRNVGINVPRFEESRYLMEPAGTNKCTNYNANPDSALSGITDGGGDATRVSNPADIASAGLQNICNDGNVVQIENNTGGSIYPSIAGPVGNTNLHTCSIWINTFGALARFGLTNFRADVTTAMLEPFAVSIVPALGTNALQFQIFPGEKIQFVLNQLEEAPVDTSPIVTEGTAGQRAIDILKWLEDGWFPHAEGMAVLDWSPGWNRLDGVSGLQQSLLNVRASAIGLIYHDRNTLKTYDGVNNPIVTMPDFLAGEHLRAVSRWNAGELDIGFWYNGGWTWSVPTAYNGSFLSDGEVIAGFQIIQPSKLSDIAIYDTDFGRQWIEDNLTPS